MLKIKKKYLSLKITISLLVLLAFFLAVAPFFKYFVLETVLQTTKIEIQNKIPSNIKPSETITPPTLKDVLKGPVNEGAIGQVIVPKYNISRSIFTGLTNINMTYGVVSLFPERNPNQNSLTLIGHHGYVNHSLFGDIEKVQKADEIFIRYLNEYYEYKVITNKIISANDTN